MPLWSVRPSGRRHLGGIGGPRRSTNISRTARVVAAAVLLASLCVLSLERPAAAAATVSAVSPLGVYGGEDPSTEQALAQSIGRQPGYAMAFLDGS